MDETSTSILHIKNKSQGLTRFGTVAENVELWLIFREFKQDCHLIP